MLYLIGLGLDLKDISLKSLEVLKKCVKVYLDGYTNKLPYQVAAIEQIIKKKVTVVQRDFLENKVAELLKEAKANNIALLVYGDPLVATTHRAIVLETKKKKIKTFIIHNVSIVNAITETGLDLYKFGKTTSIPKWCDNFKPYSFFNTIKENLSIGAHTLLLVDIDLTCSEALDELFKASSGKLDNIFICSQIGTRAQKIIKGKLKNLLSKKNIKEPFCIVVPAKLEFFEDKQLT